MTQLADKIRVKNMGYPYRMSIDKMIELIDNLDYAVWFGDALPGDVSAGMTFSSYSSGKLQTGTMPDTAVSIAGNIVTVPAGRIREEQILTVGSGSVTIDGGTVDIKAGYVENGTLTIAASSGLSVSGAKVTVGKGYLSEDDEVTIQSGSAAVNGNTVTITEGYLPEQTVTISSGSVSIDRNKVTVTEGYVQNNTLTVQSGSVTYHPDQSKVIVAEGYISDDEIDIPAGFQLVKVTNYHPAREGFDAVGSVVVSVGNVEGEYGAADFSDVDGTYVVTPETQYKKGMDRIYKQQNGRYYLCGYEPENDWGDSPHWYISETIGNYGWNSKMYFNGNTIPSGANSWYSEMVGNFTMTTTLNIVTVEGLSETTSAVSVTGFDDENADWQTGEAVDVSGYSLTPQTDGIYYLKGGKLIGQHIDRELNIPQDGLVRRWKAVGKHLVETFWGTEMLPDGEISFDESGYCGNTAAPLSKGNSCMYTTTLHKIVVVYRGMDMVVCEEV